MRLIKLLDTIDSLRVSKDLMSPSRWTSDTTSIKILRWCRLVDIHRSRMVAVGLNSIRTSAAVASQHCYRNSDSSPESTDVGWRMCKVQHDLSSAQSKCGSWLRLNSAPYAGGCESNLDRLRCASMGKQSGILRLFQNVL